MGKRNLNDPNIADIFRRLKRLETNTMLASASVGRGRLRFYDGSTLLIENGALNVTGTATIAGVLDVTGTTNLAGTTNISGPLNVTGVTTISGQLGVTGPTNLDGVTTINGDTTITGQLDVTGPTNIDGVLTINGDTSITGLLEITGDSTISGTLDIKGNTTVASDFEIIGGGLFKSGVTKIEPTGKATFGSFVIDPSSPRLIQAPGGWLFSDGSDSIGLAGSATSSVNLNSTRAELVYGSTSRVVADGAGVTLSAVQSYVSQNLTVGGTITVTGNSMLNAGLRLSALTSTTAAANLVRGTGNWLYVSSSASRFKLDVQPLTLPETLLDIQMQDWVDKGEHERGEQPRRIPGVIAEEVLDSGGRQFTTWTEDGEILGVDYDRLALAITQILKHQVADLRQRVEAVEATAA